VTPRYRLGLTEPLFRVPMPTRMRGLTETELDELARSLRGAETALRGYDEALGGRLGAIEGFEDPWWNELRPELLRRGIAPQHADDNMGGGYGADWVLRQDLAGMFGMRPIAETDNGQILLGYGPEGPPPKLPWQTEGFSPQISERRADGPEERWWLPVYEGLLSWAAELCVVLQERLPPIIAAREHIEHLHFEVGFLTSLEGSSALPCHPRLTALVDQLALLARVLSGLHEDLNHPREQLVENLASVLRIQGATWRKPQAEGMDLFVWEIAREQAAAGVRFREHAR
jgi:hypothetical protein